MVYKSIVSFSRIAFASSVSAFVKSVGEGCGISRTIVNNATLARVCWREEWGANITSSPHFHF